MNSRVAHSLAVLAMLAAASCNPPPGGGPSAVPDPRTDAMMAYDPAQNNVVMFGGVNRSGVLQDTWTWNGRAWQLQKPQHSPPGREFAVMAYDPDTQRVVLFGGVSCGPPSSTDLIGCGYESSSVTLSDTWTWDGHDWSPLQTQHAPQVPNFNGDYAGAGADLTHKQLILLTFGAPIPDADTQTWTLQHGDWEQLYPEHQPPDLEFGGPAFDSVSHRLVVHQSKGPHIDCYEPTPCGQPLTHNTTWVWDGSDWVDLGAGVPTPDQSGTLLSAGSNGLVLVSSVEYTWNGARWSAAKAGLDPLRTAWSAAFDDSAGQLILFGGRSFESNHLFDDTLVWTGRGWSTLVAARTSPSVGALPLCSPNQSVRGIGGGPAAQGAPRSAGFDVAFGEPPAGACHLDTVVHFTLLSPSGETLPIEGNPGQIHLVADLTYSSGQIWASFTVTNLCGLDVTAEFVADDLTASVPASGPQCSPTSGTMTITASIVHRSDLH